MVSVIIPVYNAEKYIEDTINSVLDQTYKDWEILLIDDGSTDHSAEIIKQYLDNPEIKYFHKENEGVSLTRNLGIELAKGAYIAFLDADDTWEPKNLEMKMDILINNPDVDWVFSDMYNMNENKERYGIAASGTDANILEDILRWEREVIPGPCSNIVVRRKCLDTGIRFDPRFTTAADQDFCLQLASQFKGKHIAQPLWSYRIISTSMSRNIKVMEKDHIGVFLKAKKRNLFRSILFRFKCFSNLYLILAGSWWKDGRNKLKGIYYLMLAVITFPPIILKLANKRLS